MTFLCIQISKLISVVRLMKNVEGNQTRKRWKSAGRLETTECNVFQQKNFVAATHSGLTKTRQMAGLSPSNLIPGDLFFQLIDQIQSFTWRKFVRLNLQQLIHKSSVE